MSGPVLTSRFSVVLDQCAEVKHSRWQWEEISCTLTDRGKRDAFSYFDENSLRLLPTSLNEYAIFFDATNPKKLILKKTLLFLFAISNNNIFEIIISLDLLHQTL